MTYPTYPTLITLPNELEGERITLRPLRPSDGPPMLEAIDESRAEIDEWLAWPPMQRTVDDTVDYCIRMAAEWIRRDSLTVGIFETATGRYLGGTGFHDLDWHLRSFEIGYWLRTSAVGHGYMTEAVEMLTQFAFDDLNARRVLIRCDALNVRSRAVPERLGFKREGLLRKNFIRSDGRVNDTLFFALTDDDWVERRSAATS